MDWLTAIGERLCSQPGQETPRTVVRVTVAAVRGSAPREPGACMLVGEHSEDGTIGGGHLELLATDIARQMLSETAGEHGRLDRFPLGATLGQCCGGIVELWFERFTAADLEFIEQALALRKNGMPLVLATTISRLPATRHRLLDSASPTADAAATALLQENSGAPRTLLQHGAGGVDVLYERVDRETTPLWLFGAGHVGKALAKMFAELPLELTWVDSRDAIFPVEIPHNVRVAQYDVPADAVADAPANAMFLVLTHSHDMDFDICRAILERGEFAWAGLIGSKTKAARFVQRLRQRGFSSGSIARLTCPIGIDGIDSKLPAAIAVAVAAQVLQIIEAQRATRTQPESLKQAKS
jgi:xanthine dehydrogenase accessory factor